MITEEDVVYISGPMTGMPLLNFPKFFGMAGLIAKVYHCAVLNPARHASGKPYQYYMDWAVADLSHTTVMVLLKGWRESRGAVFEYSAAAKFGNIAAVEENVLLRDIQKRLQLANPQYPMKPLDFGGGAEPSILEKISPDKWEALRKALKNG